MKSVNYIFCGFNNLMSLIVHICITVTITVAAELPNVRSHFSVKRQIENGRVEVWDLNKKKCHFCCIGGYLAFALHISRVGVEFASHCDVSVAKLSQDEVRLQRWSHSTVNILNRHHENDNNTTILIVEKSFPERWAEGRRVAAYTTNFPVNVTRHNLSTDRIRNVLLAFSSGSEDRNSIHRNVCFQLSV